MALLPKSQMALGLLALLALGAATAHARSLNGGVEPEPEEDKKHSKKHWDKLKKEDNHLKEWLHKDPWICLHDEGVEQVLTGDITDAKTFASPSVVESIRPDGLSGSTVNHALLGEPVTVCDESGTWVRAESWNTWDSVIYLYRDPYNVANPLANVIAVGDDKSETDSASQLQYLLPRGTYQFVIAGYDAAEFGPYNATISLGAPF